MKKILLSHKNLEDKTQIPLVKSNEKLMAPLILVVFLIAILFSFAIGFFLGKSLNQTKTPLPSPVTQVSPTLTPIAYTPNPTSISQEIKLTTEYPTPKPAPTPAPKTFEEEEKSLRKVIATFEMYIGTRNTAGALTLFTAPKTESAKKKYKEIHDKNLPYGLKGWSFQDNYTNGKYLLIVKEIENGYLTSVTEWRTNNEYAKIVYLEIVRDKNAENGFLIDRYYTSDYYEQRNNLGEEIKYQGFEF